MFYRFFSWQFYRDFVHVFINLNLKYSGFHSTFNGINLFSDCSLIIYNKSINFLILSLNPSILVNSLVSLKNNNNNLSVPI